MSARLPSGGLIDRTRRLRFSFDGRRHEGFAGDTLASALLANGVDVLNRSFKYARPRGLVTAGADEPNAIVQLGATEATSGTDPLNAACSAANKCANNCPCYCS